MSIRIIGLSFLSLYNNQYMGFLIQKIPVILILGYITGRLGYANNSVSISFDSLYNSLLEAARMKRNMVSDLFRKILLSLDLPRILEGFLFVTVRSSIDYASTLFLAPKLVYSCAFILWTDYNWKATSWFICSFSHNNNCDTNINSNLIL